MSAYDKGVRHSLKGYKKRALSCASQKTENRTRA